VIDDGVPVAVGFFLVFGDDHEPEHLALLEVRAAVAAEAGDAEYRELDRERFAVLGERFAAEFAHRQRHGSQEPGRGGLVEGTAPMRPTAAPCGWSSLALSPYARPRLVGR
jgi:hypothetical protein